VRSHHANGEPKDFAFQADQQLYPMLELADFWRFTGTLPEGVDWSAVEDAWAATLDEVAPALELPGTGENAADDPPAAPFIAGSQILLWYVALRLAELARARALRLGESELPVIGPRGIEIRPVRVML
jgi:uncharacterized protein